MTVYAEWHWSCSICDDHSEEPWGDRDNAADEERTHMREFHPEVIR